MDVGKSNPPSVVFPLNWCAKFGLLSELICGFGCRPGVRWSKKVSNCCDDHWSLEFCVYFSWISESGFLNKSQWVNDCSLKKVHGFLWKHKVKYIGWLLNSTSILHRCRVAPFEGYLDWRRDLHVCTLLP